MAERGSGRVLHPVVKMGILHHLAWLLWLFLLDCDLVAGSGAVISFTEISADTTVASSTASVLFCDSSTGTATVTLPDCTTLGENSDRESR